MSYQQLTLDERYQISAFRIQGFSPAEIARRLDRNSATITRELARNSMQRIERGLVIVYYDPLQAQRQMTQRRRAKGIVARRIQGSLQQIVESKLRQGWSPEQISGRLRLEANVRISHETIYQHVIRDTHEQRGVLRYCLRFGGYKQHRCRKSTCGEHSRARKRWLDDRPAAANERHEIGHWERDCLLGTRGDSALLTLVDRTSRYSRIRHVPKVTVDHVAKATVDAIRPFQEITRSLTNDNGAEFQRAHDLEKVLGVPVFFCEPSSPWQRGSIENLNGLLRQFVPKRMNLDALPSWATASLEDTLNHRPRKTLGYCTPHEVHFQTRMELMSASVRFGLEFSLAT